MGLRGLRISLGPELRAVYPVVLNMGVAGDVELSGAATPGRLRPAGTLHLDGGEVRGRLHVFRVHPQCTMPSRGGHALPRA